ncbi:MAG: hypothetical protein A2080_03060 [Ignavibacteria bacterium GWC2_36_12]|nr:MAG: hypothetical protein A2080_03060 [Ignavibacteria bacterium GWC2_36_12]
MTLAFLFGVWSEYSQKLRSWLKIFEVEAFLLAILALIMVINTSGELTRTQEKELSDLNEKLKREEFARDSISKALSIELTQRSRELENEKIKRLELEKDISPRIIKRDYFARLRKYKNIKVAIESVNDLEARRFAGYLNSGFNLANWSVVLIGLREDWLNIEDGVTMYARVAISEDSLSKEIMQAYGELIKIFKDNKILLRPWVNKSRYPEYEINIIIGFRPVPNIFLNTKLANSNISLSNIELKELCSETIKQLDELSKMYKEKKESADSIFKEQNPNKFEADFFSGKLSGIAFYDSSRIWNQKRDSVANKIEEEERFVFKRDYDEKVQLILDEYIKKYPEARKILSDKHYTREGFRYFYFSFPNFYWVLKELLEKFSAF